MQEAPEGLVSQIRNFLSGYFKIRQYFACIYGSYANGRKNDDSDVDIIIATESYTQRDFKKLKSFIINFHKNNGLKIDNEVPFKNKLVISYKDFTDAVNLKAFPSKNGRFVVPKIVKTKEFLESRQIKLRLALNAITSPHIFFGNDKKTYLKLKKMADRNITVLAQNLLRNHYSGRGDLLGALMFSKNGESGEMYLGYEEYPEGIGYLKKLINRGLKYLNDRRKEPLSV